MRPFESYAPPTAGVPHLGFATPLEPATEQGDLRMLAVIATFTTAHDAAELTLETFLPADPRTAARLRSLTSTG